MSVAIWGFSFVCLGMVLNAIQVLADNTRITGGITRVLTATCRITVYSLQMSKTRSNPCNAPSKPQIPDQIHYTLTSGEYQYGIT